MTEPNDSEERQPFKPCIGDIVMRGHAEGCVATCGVVKQVYEALDGDRFYIVATTMNIVTVTGPEKLTQEMLDTLGYHPATREEWQADLADRFEWFAEKQQAALEEIQPFVE